MNPKLNPKTINTTALAYIGDAVYEIYVRKHVLETSCDGSESVSYGAHVDALHKRAVRYVRAGSQAEALKAMMNSGFLSSKRSAERQPLSESGRRLSPPLLLT